MTYYAAPDDRARLIAGLLDLAVFLEANPGVPTPPCADVLVFPTGGTNAEMRAEIDVIAARINAEPRETVSRHYAVSRFFGPVEYRAVAIDRTADDSDGSE
jgi:hypothetical protein